MISSDSLHFPPRTAYSSRRVPPPISSTGSSRQNVSLNVSNNYEHRASGHPCDSETQRTQRASLSMDISAENMSSIGGSQITSDTDNANNNRNGDFKDVCVQNSNYGININIINTQFPGMGLGLASAVSFLLLLGAGVAAVYLGTVIPCS